MGAVPSRPPSGGSTLDKHDDALSRALAIIARRVLPPVSTRDETLPPPASPRTETLRHPPRPPATPATHEGAIRTSAVRTLATAFDTRTPLCLVDALLRCVVDGAQSWATRLVDASACAPLTASAADGGLLMLRSEALALLALVARHYPALLAAGDESADDTLPPIATTRHALLSGFSCVDETVRTTAVRVIELTLRGRIDRASEGAIADGMIDGDDDETRAILEDTASVSLTESALEKMMAHELASVHLPRALGDASAQVRAAAASCYALLLARDWRSSPATITAGGLGAPEARSTVRQRLVRLATADRSTIVVAAACRALGAAAPIAWRESVRAKEQSEEVLAQDREFVGAAANALAQAAAGGSGAQHASTRLQAIAALGNLAAALACDGSAPPRWARVLCRAALGSLDEHERFNATATRALGFLGAVFVAARPEDSGDAGAPVGARDHHERQWMCEAAAEAFTRSARLGTGRRRRAPPHGTVTDEAEFSPSSAELKTCRNACIAAERMLRAIPMTCAPSWAIPLTDALVLVLAEPGGDMRARARAAAALHTPHGCALFSVSNNDDATERDLHLKRLCAIVRACIEALVALDRETASSDRGAEEADAVSAQRRQRETRACEELRAELEARGDKSRLHRVVCGTYVWCVLISQVLLRRALVLACTATSDGPATLPSSSLLLAAAQSIVEHADWLYEWLLNTSGHDADAANVEGVALSRLMHSIAVAVREYGASTSDSRSASRTSPHEVSERFAARAQQLAAHSVRRAAASPEKGTSDDEDEEL